MITENAFSNKFLYFLCHIFPAASNFLKVSKMLEKRCKCEKEGTLYIRKSNSK